MYFTLDSFTESSVILVNINYATIIFNGFTCFILPNVLSLCVFEQTFFFSKSGVNIKLKGLSDKRKKSMKNMK